MVLVSCLIEIRLAIETLLKWIVDFWDFFVVEIKYSITKKNYAMFVVKIYPNVPPPQKTSLLSYVHCTHLYYYPFHNSYYCPANFWILKFEDQILNDPILLSLTCF